MERRPLTRSCCEDWPPCSHTRVWWQNRRTSSRRSEQNSSMSRPGSGAGGMARSCSSRASADSLRCQPCTASGGDNMRADAAAARQGLRAAGGAWRLTVPWLKPSQYTGLRPGASKSVLRRAGNSKINDLAGSARSARPACVQLPGPLAVGRQIGPGVARLGVGQGLLVPIRIARSWEAEHRPLPGRGPLDDLEPV